MKQAFEPADKGLVGINKIANAWGMNQFELLDELEMTKGLELTDKLLSMINVYTQGQEDGKTGRPQKSSWILHQFISRVRRLLINFFA